MATDNKPGSLAEAAGRSASGLPPQNLEINAPSVQPPTEPTVKAGGPWGRIKSYLDHEKERKNLVSDIEKAKEQVGTLKLVEKGIQSLLASDTLNDTQRSQLMKAEVELKAQLAAANSNLNGLFRSPIAETQRQKDAAATLNKKSFIDRFENLVETAGNVRSALGYASSAASAAITGAKAITGVAATAAGTVASSVAVPINAAQTLISGVKTINSARHLKDDLGGRSQAADLREKYKEDPLLSGFAKRVETKHGRNAIEHALQVAGNAVGTLSSGINTVGGIATLASGPAAPVVGAVSVGAGTAVAVASYATSAASFAYDSARSLSSQLKKAEVFDAEKCIAKLKQAGRTEYDAQMGVDISKNGMSKVGQAVNSNPLTSAIAQSVVGGRSGGINLARAEPAPDLAGNQPGQEERDPNRKLSVREKLAAMKNDIKGAVTNRMDKAFGVESGDQIFIKDSELKGLKAMQDHAVKHGVRDMEPTLKKLAGGQAEQKWLENHAQVPAAGEKGFKEFKQLEKAEFNNLKAGLTKDLKEHYQNLDNLEKHVKETKVARDSNTAAKDFCARLREECKESFEQRGGTQIIASDLSPDRKAKTAVNMLRDFGYSEDAIAELATNVSHENTLEVAEATLKKGTGMRSR